MTKYGRLLSATAVSAVLAFAAFTSFPAPANSAAAPEATQIHQSQPRVVSPGASEQSLTVYSNLFAIVQEIRQVDLQSGANSIQLDGVSSQYTPQTLMIVSVEGGDFGLRSVSYQPANLSAQRLLTLSIGKKVTITYGTNGGAAQSITGKLLSVTDGELIVLPDVTPDQPRIINKRDSVELPELPAGLSRTSSLTLDGQAAKTGPHALKIVYQTGGLSWAATHSVVFDEKSNTLRVFDTSVSVQNGSGTAFADVTLKLLAGDVRNNSPRAAGARFDGAERAMAPMAAEATSESVGEQKLYAVPGKVTLTEGENKQIPLFSARNVPVNPEFVLPPNGLGRQAPNGKLGVNLILKVTNEQASRLGKPIPAGGVKVYQSDSAGLLQLTATPSIGHIAIGEKFELNLGTSTDVKAERKLVDFKEDARPTRPSITPVEEAPRFRTETWEVTVFNYKTDRAVDVKVQEAFGGKTDFLNSTHKFEKDAAGFFNTTVKVPAGSQTVVTFTVRTQIN